MSRSGIESRAWKWKCNTEQNRWGPFSTAVDPLLMDCLHMGWGSIPNGRGKCMPLPSTYLPSSTFDINEYYLINIIITSINMNRNLLNGNAEINGQICMLF